MTALEGFAVLLGCLLVGTGLKWVGDVFWGLPKLQRYVERRGYVLTKARWLPFFWTREAVYKVTLVRGEEVQQGRAYVGGFWWGPMLSRSVEFDWGKGGSSEDSPPIDRTPD
jgi:hypothetical protein